MVMMLFINNHAFRSMLILSVHMNIFIMIKFVSVMRSQGHFDPVYLKVPLSSNLVKLKAYVVHTHLREMKDNRPFFILRIPLRGRLNILIG